MTGTDMDANQLTPSSNHDMQDAADAVPKRHRGVIAELNELEGGGWIQAGQHRLRYRAIDLIGQASPAPGDSLSFQLKKNPEEAFATRIVLDKDPQFIPGQSSLHDCYQAHAKTRRQRQRDEHQRSPAAVLSAADIPSTTGSGYRRCEACLKMVLPKRRLGGLSRRSLRQGKLVCPSCQAPMDAEPAGASRFVLLGLLLIGCCLWWLI